MKKGNELFVREGLDYTGENDVMVIHLNFFQKLTFPQEYPALIQVHMEHPAMDVPMHWHPGPELIYSRNKNIQLTVDGRRVHICPGEFALVSSMALHALEPVCNEVRQDVMSITFRAGYLEKIMPKIKHYFISASAPSATEESRHKMCAILEELRIHLNGTIDYFKTNAYLFSILHLIYTDFLADTQKDNSKLIKTRDKMIGILDYMNKNYAQPLTTQLVADHFGYTRVYFCRLFSRYGDTTFKQHLTDLRLTAAVQDLITSNRNVGAIAIEHGFPDKKSFFSAFKKRYHVTPTQYRKELQ